MRQRIELGVGFGFGGLIGLFTGLYDRDRRIQELDQKTHRLEQRTFQLTKELQEARTLASELQQEANSFAKNVEQHRTKF